VDLLKSRGTEFVKVQSGVPREAYFAIAAEAKRVGIPFEGHVPDAIRASEAVAAGQVTFEHLIGIFEASSPDEDKYLTGEKKVGMFLATYDPAREANIIKLLAKNHIWQCPTLYWERGQWLVDAIDYNQDPAQGIADAVFSPDRVDTAFIDRLLSKCTDHLSLLAAPATLDRVYDFGADAFDAIFDTLRTTMPCIVLDIPHQWSGWTRRALVAADDILIVAAPDLANLRNTKNIFDLLKAARPNDRMPLYCLNQVGIPKRPEINAGEFAKAIECDPIVSIPFDPQMFGAAANNGQMIAEISENHRSTEMFRQIAQRLTGRGETKKPRGSFLSPLIEKLRSK